MNRWTHLFAAGIIAAVVAPVDATFHFIQIEQVVGGVNGDTTAQAIQVRFRSGGQHLQAGGRMRVWDANGQNPIIVADPTTNLPGPSQAGDRVLFATANFVNHLDSAISIDYPMTNAIPESYLAAGSLTFETNNGTVIYWRLSWGGASYTGSNAGAITNDSDGNFGPPFPGPLPSTGVQAVLFQGPATALSTNNADDYELTSGAATFTNYSDQSATLVEATLTGACCMPDGSCVDETVEDDCIAAGGVYQGHKVLCATIECPQPKDCPADTVSSKTFAPPPDGQVDAADLAFLLGEWGKNPGSPADTVDSSTFAPPPDGTVDAADLAFLLGSWGPCP